MSLLPISSWGGWGYRHFHSASNLEVGSRNRTQVVRLAQHAHCQTWSGECAFQARTLRVGLLAFKVMMQVRKCQRVCAFLLNSYLVMYHQPFLVKVKHKMNYVVCDSLFIQVFFPVPCERLKIIEQRVWCNKYFYSWVSHETLTVKYLKTLLKNWFLFGLHIPGRLG